MNLLILQLGKEGQYRWKGCAYHLDSYRGTFRDHPPYPVDGYDLSHVLNQAIYKILPERNDFSDIKQGKEILDIIRSHIQSEQYELIGCSVDEKYPATDHIFLGYDVSIACGPSILWEALSQYVELINEEAPLMYSPYSEVKPLFDLYEHYFRDQLNEFGLFADYGQAKWFLDCVMAINKICPNMFDHSSNMDEYKITSIYEI
jgi:hypothetical protein